MGDAWEGRDGMVHRVAPALALPPPAILNLSIIHQSAGRRPRPPAPGGLLGLLGWRLLAVTCVWRVCGDCGLSRRKRALRLGPGIVRWNCPPFITTCARSTRARAQYASHEFGWLAASSQTKAGVGCGRSCCLAGVAPWRHASVPPLLGGAQCAGAPDGGVAGLRAMVVGYESGYGCSCSHSRAPAAKKACLFCRRLGGS